MAERKRTVGGYLDVPVWKDWLFYLWVLAMIAGVAAAYGSSVTTDVYGNESFTPGLGFLIDVVISCAIQSFLFLVLPGAARNGWRESKAKDQPKPPTAPPPLLASWQKDPTGRHELRWWDGQAWTSNVSSRGLTGEDPYP